jgi:hypothetical protein
VNAGDAVKMHFEEVYEMSADLNDYILVKDLFATYKQTDYYKLMDKNVKKNLIQAKFLSSLAGNRNFKGFYQERFRPYVNGIHLNIRNVLVGVKLRPTEDEGFVDVTKCHL